MYGCKKFNLNKFLIIFFICIFFNTNLVYSFTYTSHIADKRSKTINNLFEDVLSELKECREVYHNKMQSFFNQFNIALPTDEEKRTCDFKSVGAYVDITKEFILVLQGNDKLDKYVDYIRESVGEATSSSSNEINDTFKACENFLSKKYLEKECINTSDEFIPLKKYQALLYAYKYCAMQYGIYMIQKNSTSGKQDNFKDILISSTLSVQDKINKWINDEIIDSALALPIAVAIYREEKKAAQIIQPICKLIDNLNMIRLITFDMRNIIMKWIPIIPKRQLMDGQ